jgi:hypothetical protein
MIESFKIKKMMKNACQLKLSQSMKIHDTFHIFLLRFASIDSLIEQIQSSSSSIIVDEEEKYEINDILNNRYHYNKLQYRISWIEHSSNDAWYSTENFDHAKKIMKNYHARYSTKSESALRRNEAHTTNVIIWINQTSTLIEKKLVETRRFLNQTKEMIKDILIKMNEKYQEQRKKLTFSKKNLFDWTNRVY